MNLNTMITKSGAAKLLFASTAASHAVACTSPDLLKQSTNDCVELEASMSDETPLGFSGDEVYTHIVGSLPSSVDWNASSINSDSIVDVDISISVSDSAQVMTCLGAAEAYMFEEAIGFPVQIDLLIDGDIEAIGELWVYASSVESTEIKISGNIPASVSGQSRTEVVEFMDENHSMEEPSWTRTEVFLAGRWDSASLAVWVEYLDGGDGIAATLWSGDWSQ